MPNLRLALFEPDIPQNAGAILRLGACLGAAVDIVEPAGFRMDDARLKRAGLDYAEMAVLRRHASFDAFEAWRRGEGRRLVLFTTAGAVCHVDFDFRPDDVLLFGRESAGVTEPVRAAADAAVTIPLLPGRRSLNVATAAAIGLAEALRQTGGLPMLPAQMDPPGNAG
jgi:tRNA (cytidine/uridine-2'-O-)-methyltransferase